MPYKYVGRKHSFVGHNLWHIITSLPNYGRGRLVYRHMFMRYIEPSFYKIVDAKPQMDKLDLKGSLTVEEWFRGRFMGEVDLSRYAYKTDYRLVPRDEEEMWLEAAKNTVQPTQRVLPRFLALPPLIRLRLEQKEEHIKEIPLLIQVNERTNARIAEEGEEPNISVNEMNGVGTSLFPHLYADVDFTKATHPPDPNSLHTSGVPRPAHPKDDPAPKCPVYLESMEEQELGIQTASIHS